MLGVWQNKANYEERFDPGINLDKLILTVRNNAIIIEKQIHEGTGTLTALEILQQLQHSLIQVDELVHHAVARAEAAGSDPTNALRGLIISHDEVQEYLQRAPLAAPYFHAEALPFLPADLRPSVPGHPLNRLMEVFELQPLDSYIFLLTLAPELDRRYERLYAFLQDDVSQRRPTVGLMMNLLGTDLDQRFAVWERLQAEKPLRKYRLLDCVADTNRQHPTFAAYQLKIDHRVVAYLLGDTHPDERIAQAVRLESASPERILPDEMLRPIHAAFRESPLIYMKGARGMGQAETAAALCAAYDLPLLSIDLATLGGRDLSFELHWGLALREGYLAGAGLLLDGWETCLNERREPSVAFWQAVLNYPLPVFICGEKDWEPLDLERSRRMLRLNFSIPAFAERLETWQRLIQAHTTRLQPADLEEIAAKFRFTRHQIARAINAAADRARSRGEYINRADLYSGAQSHASLQLGHMAQRIAPRFEWSDLILPPDQLEQLHELTARARFGHVVNDQWGFGGKIANSMGISALFAGESGTGKTLAAEVLARELGLVLYRIDLSAVVSKYIGETEKNLNTIFTEAQSSNAILFFDEADALFGKRSEVKDARDRYANIEVAYLLQQVESYDGIVILASNFRQNIDEAFTRRLDFLVDFPFPDAEYRLRIWQAHFPPNAPLAADVNLHEFAERYRLAGGNIRNVALAAAYLAASDGQIITPAHLRSAIRREHQKMGRLLEDVQ